jgi:hypothetical protein
MPTCGDLVTRMFLKAAALENPVTLAASRALVRAAARKLKTVTFSNVQIRGNP